MLVSFCYIVGSVMAPLVQEVDTAAALVESLKQQGHAALSPSQSTPRHVLTAAVSNTTMDTGWLLRMHLFHCTIASSAQSLVSPPFSETGVLGCCAAQ